MSIICCVYLSEGVIMAADSRLTGYKTMIDEKNSQVSKILSYTISDNAQKIVLLSKVQVGISSCGDAILGQKTFADYIRIFEIERVTKEDTVETVANKLFEYAQPFRGKASFFVCGYTNDQPFAFAIAQSVKRINITPDTHTVTYGSLWSGQSEAITKLMISEPKMLTNYYRMPLKDGIDFAEFLIDTTIKYERFKDNVQTCGGDIDILVLTKDDAFWHQHKIYKP